MALLPIHSDQQIDRIAAPYVTWGVMLLCIVVQVWMSGLPPREEWIAAYTWGFIPGGLFAGLDRPPPIDLLPSELTLVTYQFLHGGLGHLIGNMVVLFVFGGVLENRLLHLRFALLYLGSGVVAGLSQGLAAPDETTVLVGASGAVAGVLGAYIALFPHARIVILGPLFIPFRLRAWVVIGVWFLFQALMARYAGDTNVAWWAHVGGFLTGLAAGMWYRHRPV